MFFTDKKRKKNLLFSLLALTFFCGVIFLAQTHSVHAEGSVFDISLNPFKYLFYTIFVFFGWLTSVAVTIFGFYTDPDTFGLLNRSSVYEMWKFIRDFFNLFFILTLLYVAFKIVFQIDKDYKKMLLSLALAALYINFSFPVSRALIDMTNVPMYFFANQMMSDPSKPGESFGTALRASQLKGILVPDSIGYSNLGAIDTSRLLAAVIFLFLFSITLLILAILFANRVVFLIILVIFSPIGFAAFVFPGMGEWSKKWWEHFWKNALFGPAAMLGLLIATRFLAEIAQDQTFSKIKTVATQASTASEMDFIASMVMFSVPIIMLWMVMALGNTMSIIGASGLISMGQNFSKWMGKTVGGAPFKGAWALTKFGGRKLDSNVLSKYHISPKAWIGAVKDWAEHSKHEDNIPVDKAKGEAHNMINKLLQKTIGQVPGFKKLVVKDTFDYKLAEIEKVKVAKKKEASDNASGVKDQSVALRMMKEGEEEHDEEKILGAMDMLSETNGWNDYIRGKFEKNSDGSYKYEKAADGITDKLDEGGNKIKIPMRMNTKNARAEVERLLNSALPGEKNKEMRQKLRTGIGIRAEAAGNGALAGMTIIDENGEYKDQDEEEQAVYATWKWLQQDAQKGMQSAHPDMVFESEFTQLMEDDPDNPGKERPVIDPATDRPVKGAVYRDLNGVTARKWASRLTAGHAGNWKRGRELIPVLQKQLLAAVKKPNQYPELINAYKKFKGFQLLVDSMVDDSEGTTGLDDFYKKDEKRKIINGTLFGGEEAGSASTGGASGSSEASAPDESVTD